MASSYRFVLSIIILLTCYIGCVHSQLVQCSTDECICPHSSIAGEKCILNCNEEDSCKSSILRCRAGDPCEIRCEAKSACAQDTNIIADTATDVTLICNGKDTCKSATTLGCGSGDCLMSCQGIASCDEFGPINVSLSASFECSGNCPLDIPPQFSRTPTTTPTATPTTTVTQTPTASQGTVSPTSPPTAMVSLETTLSLASSTASSMIQTTMDKISTSWATNQDIISQSDVHHGLDENGTVLMIDLDDIHPLYYAITLLLVLIVVVCCALFCWIYISHYRTQKLIKQQQARLDSRSLNFQNIPMSFNRVPAYHCKSPSFEMQTPFESETNHKIAIASPTATSRSTYTQRIQQHASPRMYRVYSIEKTPTTVNKKATTNYKTIHKKAKHEGNESIHSDTTLSDSDTNLSSNALSKDIWDVPEKPKDGDSTTMTAAVTRNTQMHYIGYTPYTDMRTRAAAAPPSPPLPLSNATSDKVKAMDSSCDLPVASWKYGADSSHHSCYGYAVTLRHVQQLHRALQHGSGGCFGPSVTEATGTIPSTLSHCSESDAITSCILQHMNTDDMHSGEAYDDSMIAVRHPTISSDPYEFQRCTTPTYGNRCTPIFHVQVKTGDTDGLSGLTLVDLDSKTKETEETFQPPHVGLDHIENVRNQLKEKRDDTENNIDTLYQCICQRNKIKKEKDHVLTLQKKVVIDIPRIPEEISKSFKSYTIERTAAANECSKDCFNEDSVDPNELDRNSYAIQLVDDEPTLTKFKSNSKTTSSIMDTYLKFLNI